MTAASMSRQAIDVYLRLYLEKDYKIIRAFKGQIDEIEKSVCDVTQHYFFPPFLLPCFFFTT